MDIDDFRVWFEQKRTEAKQRMACKFCMAQKALTTGHLCEARNALYWTREIRYDWKFFDEKLW